MSEHMHTHLDAIRSATDKAAQTLTSAETRLSVVRNQIDDATVSLILEEICADLRDAFDTLVGS